MRTTQALLDAIDGAPKFAAILAANGFPEIAEAIGHLAIAACSRRGRRLAKPADSPKKLRGPHKKDRQALAQVTLLAQAHLPAPEPTLAEPELPQVRVKAGAYARRVVELEKEFLLEPDEHKREEIKARLDRMREKATGEVAGEEPAELPAEDAAPAAVSISWTPIFAPEPAPVRRRGRQPGSKNKPKAVPAPPPAAEPAQQEPPATPPRRDFRPFGTHDRLNTPS
ncbi:hypothetical protein [Hymenobacter metallicola]|uniref:Uncharacterized protein n=1 Tax=Hymenobacter metallicola TaxID=2563114 RepID=A0A4Z0QKR2_9BACT|nr:hypothetical protein [Hymenobacter metallicola]TGE29833.1 hypothetical protein E5K02_10340 [Hymenobacter metallicola]